MAEGQQGTRDEQPPDPVRRFALWSLAAASASLGLRALGPLSFPVPPFDVLCALGAPAWLLVAWPQRRALTRDPLLLAWLGFAAAWLLASFVHPGTPRTLLTNLLKGLQAPTVALGAAAVARAHGTALPLRAWLYGTAASLLVGFAGYALALAGHGGLAFTSAHPVFAHVPRMVGTFGESPQHFGEYLLVSLGVAHASHGDRLARAVRSAGWLGLVLTFSSAWVGGICLALGLPSVARRLPVPALRWGGVFACALAATWLMTFSLPRAEPKRGSLAELDPHHVALHCRSAGDCTQQMRHTPYDAPLTLYRAAKEQAAEAARQSFPWGLGPGGFEAYARARIGASPSGSVPVYYVAPHSTYLGALAELGLPGLLAVVALLFTLGRHRRTPLHPLWLSLIGLLLVGLNIDVLRQRHLWVALGLLAAANDEEVDARV